MKTEDDKKSEFKEKIAHGDIFMHMQHYRSEIPLSYKDLTLHWHEEMEIGWIADGKVNYDIGFEICPAGKDDILLISPHMLHSAHEIRGCGMISESLVFHLDMLGYQTPDACTVRYVSPLQKGKFKFVPVIHPCDPGHAQLLGCLKQLFNLITQREDRYELWIKELLFRFFRLLYEFDYVMQNEGLLRDSDPQKKLKSVLNYIAEHYTEDLSVEQLAAICHFSQAHFMSFFKKYAGMTTIEYINRYRLSAAAEQIAQTDRTVMEIALDSGYHNISYFNRLFRDQFGVTPREYRKAVPRLPVV